MIGLVFGIFFAIMALLELKSSIFNAFVLFTISATFLKGFIVKKENYYFVASIIALAFAILMLLVFLAGNGLSYGLAGFVTLPYIAMRRR